MVHKWRGSKRGFSASFIAAATAAVMCLAGSSDCEASTGRLDDGLNSPLSFGAGGRKDCLCAVSEHTRGSRVGSRPSTRETRIWMRTGLLGEGLRGGGPGLMPDPSWSDEIEEEGLIKVDAIEQGVDDGKLDEDAGSVTSTRSDSGSDDSIDDKGEMRHPSERMTQDLEGYLASISQLPPDQQEELKALNPAETVQWGKRRMKQLEEEGIFREIKAPQEISPVAEDLSEGLSFDKCELVEEKLYCEESWELSDSKLRDSHELHAYNEFVKGRKRYIKKHGPTWDKDDDDSNGASSGSDLSSKDFDDDGNPLNAFDVEDHRVPLGIDKKILNYH